MPDSYHWTVDSISVDVLEFGGRDFLGTLGKRRRPLPGIWGGPDGEALPNLVNSLTQPKMQAFGGPRGSNSVDRCLYQEDTCNELGMPTVIFHSDGEREIAQFKRRGRREFCLKFRVRYRQVVLSIFVRKVNP